MSVVRLEPFKEPNGNHIAKARNENGTEKG